MTPDLRHEVLAIDAGKTSTRAALYRGDGRGEVVVGPGLENVAAVGAEVQIRGALADTLRRLDLPSDLVLDGVCIGLTGVLEPGPHARRVLDVLTRLAPARRVVVTSDVVTSFCGALGARAGVVIAAGTGAIALGVGADGRLARVDGWGYLLDDDGSAFAIGRAGLRDALREHDGRGGSAALAEAATRQLGPPSAILDAVYGSDNPPRTVAAFARSVSELADDGDPTALHILTEAGDALARTVLAAARAVADPHDEVPVSWSGGVFRAGSPVTDPFRRRLDQELPAAQVVVPAGDALDGAAALAATTEPTVVDALLLVAQGAPR